MGTRLILAFLVFATLGVLAAMGIARAVPP